MKKQDDELDELLMVIKGILRDNWLESKNVFRGKDKAVDFIGKGFQKDFKKLELFFPENENENKNNFNYFLIKKDLKLFNF